MIDFKFRHVQGWSVYDHYADEVIARAHHFAAEEMTAGKKEKAAMETAVARAWEVVRPRPGIGPRIDVVRA